MKFIITKRQLIKSLAKDLAEKQRKADWYFYESNNQALSSFILDKVDKDLYEKLGVTEEVYKEAYKLYDFRNSGKEGYYPEWINNYEFPYYTPLFN